MTPPPSAALALLGVWVVFLFAATSAAAVHQRRTTDVTEIRFPTAEAADSPGAADRPPAGVGAVRDRPREEREDTAHEGVPAGDSSTDRVGVVADD